jgi:pimeloyl-ACP methyl ester carboxylesterase
MYHRNVERIAAFDARPWLGELRCPSLVLVGRRDPIVPVSVGRELGRLLPQCTFEELPGGHLGFLAMPRRIRAAVSRWRTQVEQDSLPSASPGNAGYE